MAEAFLDEMRLNPGLVSPDTDPADHARASRCGWTATAADLGVAVDVIARTLESMLGGRQVTRYKQDAEQYDVIVRVAADERRDPRDIRDIYVRARDGDGALTSVVQVDERVAPRELNHFGQRRAVTITANLAPG